MADAKTENQLKSLCRAYTKTSIETLGGWAVGPEVDDDLKFRAIQALLDRGWGKPKQDSTIEISGEVRVRLRKMLDDEE